MAWEILLADDHEIIRRGVRDLIRERLSDVGDVREVGSCEELTTAVKRKVPDLLVLDLEMGDGNAIDLLELFQVRYPTMRVLVFSMSPESIFAQRVARSGVVGYLSKSSSEEEMVRAVRQVLQGEEYVSHEEAMRRLDLRDRLQALHDLSDRELMVMRGLLKGEGVVEIAAKAGLKPNTVTTYKARLFDKLGVSNVLELQRLAQAEKWI
jgi:two-component system, NarL family, invasion response regulator UvrY